MQQHFFLKLKPEHSAQQGSQLTAGALQQSWVPPCMMPAPREFKINPSILQQGSAGATKPSPSACLSPTWSTPQLCKPICCYHLPEVIWEIHPTWHYINKQINLLRFPCQNSSFHTRLSMPYIPPVDCPLCITAIWIISCSMKDFHIFQVFLFPDNSKMLVAPW